jgi:hypothetical protein
MARPYNNATLEGKTTTMFITRVFELKSSVHSESSFTAGESFDMSRQISLIICLCKLHNFCITQGDGKVGSKSVKSLK